MPGLIVVDSDRLAEMSFGHELRHVKVATVGILVDVDQLAVLVSMLLDFFSLSLKKKKLERSPLARLYSLV